MEPLEEDLGVLQLGNDYGIIDGPNTTTYRSGMGVLNVSPHLGNDYTVTNSYLGNDYSEIKNKNNDMVIPEVNTSFSMMHPDVDFVKFEVKRVNIEKRNYHEEFLDMFMKK